MGHRACERALDPSLLAALETLPGWQAGGSAPEPVLVEGRVRADAARSAIGVTLSVSIDRIFASGRWQDVEGGALISIGGARAAGAAREWVAGRRVRLRASLRLPGIYLNPGVRDEARALALRGAVVVGSVKSGMLVEVLSRGTWIEELAARARRATRHSIDATVGAWSARSAGIVTAILIGDRANLDPDVERRLQEAGTYHVIAISGGNIAVLAAVVFLALGACGLRDRRVSAVAIGVLVAYALVVGGGASVVRATSMAVVYLAARALDHRPPPLNAIAVALAVILCASPLAIFDAGFALTFGATAGILLGAGPLKARMPVPRWLGPAAGLLAASLAAEAVVLPIGLYTFALVTFAGPIMNFVAVPLMSVAQLFGMAAVALDRGASNGDGALTAVRWLAHVAGGLAHLAAAGLVESTRALAVAPRLAQRAPPPTMVSMTVYFGALALWVAARARVDRLGTGERHARWIARTMPVVAAGSAVWMLAMPPAASPLPSGRLAVVFLDVGQGDAALLRFPGGRSMLVDAGGAPGTAGFDVGARVVVPAIWARGLSRLDVLALSHGDPDHMGGAPAVLRDLRPHELWEGIDVPAHQPTRELHALAAARRSRARTLGRGDSLTDGDVGVRVWHPPRADWERQRVRNDDSLVLEVTYGAVSVLLTGDIGSEVERDLAAALPPSPLRVLKVPHHGSLTSSSDAFLAAARPAIAVVSAGRGNRYGHPAAAVIARYERAGAALFRTDRDGAVTISTDGRDVDVETFRGQVTRFTAPVPSP